MTVIVSDGRFDGTKRSYIALESIDEINNFEGNLDISSATDPALLVPHFARLDAVRVAFPSSADGRGNSIAKALRMAGYTGPLRAFGHVLADQYPLALRSGFDDVEIDEALAERQPEQHWTEAYARVDNAYQSRLKTAPSSIEVAA